MKDKQWIKGTIPIIKPHYKRIDLKNVSALGSCFSRNIYRWLIHNSITSDEICWGIFYNPFAILAELKRIFEGLNYDETVIVESRNKLPQFIDPWRTWLKKDTIEELRISNKSFDKIAINQIRKSKTIIITYGLAEVWKNRDIDHIYLNNLPPKVIIENKSSKEYISLIASQTEIYKAILDTIVIINSYLGGDVKIILTLSPIPLKFTFSSLSIREANNISKSRLLLAINEVCSLFENVIYFPSYEIIQGKSELNYDAVWQDDNRHITAKAVDFIANKFIDFCGCEIEKSEIPFFVPLINKNGTIVGKLFTDGSENIEL